MLDQLKDALDKAQTESASAEIVLLEATHHAAELRDDVQKLDAAVAALSGEIIIERVPGTLVGDIMTGPGGAPLLPPADPPTLVDASEERVAPPRVITTPGGEPYDDGRGSISGDPSVRADNAEMTQEQFANEQRRKRRESKKLEDANNPYANIACPGCGKLGSLFDSVIQAPSGAVVRMMVCGKCNNQIMQ